MTAELIISIISLASTIGLSILVAVLDHKNSKIQSLDKIHTYEKHITDLELSVQDVYWFYDLLKKGEYSNYSKDSRIRMAKKFLPELEILLDTKPTTEAKPAKAKKGNKTNFRRLAGLRGVEPQGRLPHIDQELAQHILIDRGVTVDDLEGAVVNLEENCRLPHNKDMQKLFDALKNGNIDDLTNNS